jgi:hypothetical protein
LYILGFTVQNLYGLVGTYWELNVKIDSVILVYFIKLSRCGEIAIASDCVQAFEIERQAMTCRKAESADARRIGSVMGTMSGRVPFEDLGRLYCMTI